MVGIVCGQVVQRRGGQRAQTERERGARGAGRQPHAALAAQLAAHAHGLGDELEQLGQLDAAVVGHAQLAPEVRVVGGHEAGELHAQVGCSAQELDGLDVATDKC